MRIEQVEAIAQLVRLRFSEQELEAMRGTLDEVFDLIDQIEKIDTEGLPALTHPLKTTQRTRADTVEETGKGKALRTIAPAVDQSLYLVPKVIA